MKKVSVFFAMVLAGVLFTGCQDGEKVANPRDLKAVSFSSSIVGAPAVTRASGTTWGTDRIGVTMLPAGETDYAKAHAANRCYTTTGDGNFVHASAAHAMYWPDGAVDFVAYYPHKETTTAEYTVDLLDQMTPANIDLMYAANVKNVTQGTHSLAFEHKLTKVVFNVTYLSGSSLAGAKVSLKDVPTSATFALLTDQLTEKADSKGTIAAVVSGDATAAKAEAIVLPGARTYTLQVVLANGETFEESVVADYQGGKSYTYPVNLSTAAPDGELVAGTATITDWIDVPQPALDLTTTPGTPIDPPAGGTVTTEFDFTVIYAALTGNDNLRLDQDPNAATNLTKDGVTLIASKGTHTGSYPSYYANGAAVRMYPGNTLTITGTEISKVEYVFLANYSWLSSVTAGYTAPVWEGTAVSELVFTSEDDASTSSKEQSRFTIVRITHK